MNSFAHPEISSSRSLYNLYQLPKHNLGCAILAAAIADYQGMDEQAHSSARQFLFPVTPEYQEHYDWVVAMADGVNRAWLREALDGARKRWDCERLRNTSQVSKSRTGASTVESSVISQISEPRPGTSGLLEERGLEFLHG